MTAMGRFQGYASGITRAPRLDSGEIVHKFSTKCCEIASQSFAMKYKHEKFYRGLYLVTLPSSKITKAGRDLFRIA